MEQKKPVAYIDFEGRSIVNVKTVGSVVYAQHPTTEITCMAYAIGDGPIKLWHKSYPELFISETALPLDLFDHIQAGYTIEAHNAGFERAIWENICVPKHVWPMVQIKQWKCSAAKAAVMSIPRALEDACKVLNLNVQKDMAGNRIMLKLAKPRRITKKNKAVFHESVEDLKVLWDYCKQDVESERALSKALPDLIPSEREVWLIDQEMNFRGIQVDSDFIDAAIIHQAHNVEFLNEELKDLTNGMVKKVTERDKLIRWASQCGVILYNTQADYLRDTLAYTIPNKVKRAIEIFLEGGKTSISKYNSFKVRTCQDGRLRDNLMYHGARPGRWSGKGTQLQNLPRGSISDMETVCNDIKNDRTDVLINWYGPIPTLLSHALRGSLIASPEQVLYIADFNAIEARTEFWLVDDQDTLDMFRQGKDIYKAMASTIYGVPIEEVTKEQRFIGKQAILGLGYQMWVDKFIATALDAGKQFGISVKLDYEFGKSVVLAYRNIYHKITTFWKALENAAILAIENRGDYFRVGKLQFSCGKNFLRIKLPSGRFISYYKPYLEERTSHYGIRKQICYEGAEASTHNWNPCIETFGGKLAENVTQAVSRDFMVEGMKAIHKTKRYSLLLTVHDEIISEGYPHNTNLEEYNALMSTLPSWAEGMPIKVEGWQGLRYKK